MSQLELARASKLSRPLVSALETGRHVPSVKAALAVAEVLGTTVEEVFGTDALNRFVPALGDKPPAAVAVTAVRVGGALTYHPLAESGQSWGRADGFFRDGRVTLFDDCDPAGVALAGCDPALGLVSLLLPHQGPLRLVSIPAPSGASLRALDEGRIHGALVHGRPGHLKEGARPVRRFNVARWSVGLACLPGTQIDLEQLARGGLSATRRDPESEIFQALERAMGALGGTAGIRGPAVATHLDAARRVSYGAVEVALTMEAAARAFNLEFVELEEHVSQLRIDEEWAGLPGIQAVLDVLSSGSFHARLKAVGGYDLSETGQVS